MKRIKVTALALALGVAGVVYAMQSDAQTTPAENAASCCTMANCCSDGACKMNGACCSAHRN